ncbi:PREDICTED: protein S100-A8-like [Corvus brachyrhynchos]|uniref:protein S100-A8-like n=1 Tax=Corvus brachyrhynchos TaxID=85066 RepID=UPI0008164A44|nr:PREDICTED: protein S100-A8-like [Corvus brachyrhynchos]
MSSSTHSHAGSRQFPGNCTLEKALQTVVDVFHHYSIRQGEHDLLNFNDFKTLLTEQAPSFLTACDRNKHGYVNELFQETDLNKDSELSFEEFTIVLSKVADDAHRISHDSDRCGPDQD